MHITKLAFYCWKHRMMRGSRRPLRGHTEGLSRSEVDPAIPELGHVISRRREAIRLGASYAAGLTSAHILAAGAVSVMIVSLPETAGGTPAPCPVERNLIALCGLVAISATVGGVAGVLNMVPSFRWFADGAEPTPAQQRAALRIAARQTVVQFGIWAASGAVFVLVNLRAGGAVACVIGTAICSGAPPPPAWVT